MQAIARVNRVFGDKETSLYIGKATNTIKERLQDHKRKWLSNRRGKKYVRIGLIVYPHNYDESIIDHAESAIIYEMKNDILIDNTDKCNSYSYTDLYRIENTGNVFELKPKIRMHEHEDYPYTLKEVQGENANLIERWTNDRNPVRTSGKGNGKNIEIRIVDNIDDALK